MDSSILDSTKKVLGIDATYTAYDPDIVLYINSVFSTLYQLGIGPDDGFAIESKDEVWGSFIPVDKSLLHAVKAYVYLRVRLLFDPPATSFAIAAMEKQIEQLEWRINVHREEAKYPWIDPATTTLSTSE